MAFIRIISTPPGEAPLEIRQAWVGRVLPLHYPTQKTTLTVGVLTGPKGFFGQLWAVLMGRVDEGSVYLVKAKIAVEILEEARPEAARWWREHTPHLFEANRTFGFAAEACELLAGVAPAERPNI